jgi:acetylglutamate kinase
MGLSGEDGPILWARPHAARRDGDLGWVGEVDAIDAGPILSVLDGGRIPVIASVGLGRDGHSYNVNADTAAAELAAALHAAKLILLTDVAGVRDGAGEVISSLDAAHTRSLVDGGVIAGGMIPKVAAALHAVEAGASVHIIDGRIEHALLLELLTESGIGTMVHPGIQGVAS